MKFSVTLSANAGVSLEWGGKKIWIDALHREKQPGFSPVSDELFRQMERTPAFQDPDLIVFTHCHGDHYCRELAMAAGKRYPHAAVLLPEQQIDSQVLVHGHAFSYQLGEIKLEFIRLVHEGEQYENCVHYGILIRYGDQSVLIPGDCRLTEPALADAVRGMKINLALLNFPWLTLPKPRAFLVEKIQPEHVLFYHLPFEKDDVNGFRLAAEKALQKMANPQFGLLHRPLQRVEIEL